MGNVFFKTIGVYFENFAFVLFSCLFALLSLSLLPFVSTYLSGGAGFVRFTSLIFDLNLLELLIVIVIFLASLLLMSLFVVSVVSIVKFKETLDHIGFKKVALLFSKHIFRVFVFFIVMAFISVGFGTLLTWIGLPSIIIQTLIFIFLVLFIFTPQIMVLENFPLVVSMEDSVKFIFDQPLSIIWYILFGSISLFLITLLEVNLASYFVWEHKVIILLLVTFILLPMLQIFAALLYVRRYGVARL